MTAYKATERATLDTPSISRWWNVVGGAVCMAVGQGVMISFVLGVFVKAIAADFGWDRSVVSLGLSLYEVGAFFGTPFLGLLIDRYGMRRPTVVFSAGFAGSIALIGVVPKSLPIFCLLFLITGIFGAAGIIMPFAKIIASRFDHRRGLALGLTNAGTGIGAILVPQYANYLLGHFGWRAGYFGVAAIMAAIAIPSILFLMRAPTVSQAKSTAVRIKTNDVAALCAHSRAFWLMTIAVVLSATDIAVAAHLVPMMTDRGLTPTQGAAIMSTAGLASLLGRLVSGYLMDRIFAPFVTAGAFICLLIGILFLTTGSVGLAAVIGASLVGVCIGAEADILTFMVSRYFDMRSFGRIAGTLFGIWTVSGGVGIYLLGLCFDLTKSYTIGLEISALLLVFATISILLIGPYRYARGATEPSVGELAGIGAE